MNFYAEVTSKYKITASDSKQVIQDVANLSSGTISTLLHKEGIDGHQTYVKVDKIHQKFIAFTCSALDSDPSAYKNWMDAWKYFVASYNLDTLEVKQG